MSRPRTPRQPPSRRSARHLPGGSHGHVLLDPQAVGTFMFRYPETVGVVLACNLVLGRYTGYGLTELYRFQDLS